MTVSTTTSRADYTGNGVTTTFAVPFYFLDNSHLVVYQTQISTGVITTLAITTDYTVSGAGSPSGGSITCVLPPTSNYRISILRNVPLTQLTNYVENDPFPAESHEQALDKLTMLTQQLAEENNRALTLPPTATGASTELPTPVGGTIVGWNATATGLVNYDADALASFVAYGDTNVQTASGDGVQTFFTLTSNPVSVNNLQVYISGVRQAPGVDYFISGGIYLNFYTAPPSGTNNILMVWQQALAIGTIPGRSVTADKIALRAITPALMANNGLEFVGKNWLINGDMRISQRGTVAVSLGAGANIYGGPDRWFVGAITSGNSCTISRQTTGVAGMPYCARVQRDPATSQTGTIILGQQLETLEVQSLQGKKVALTFYGRTGLSPYLIFECGMIFGTGTNQSSSDGIRGLWTGYSIQLNSEPFALVSSFNLQGFYFDVPSNATEAIVFFRYTPVGTAGASEYFDIANTQLEVVGSSGIYTPFKERPYGTELALCQRYYQKYTSAPIGLSATAASCGGGFVFPVQMRQAPGISSGSFTAATGSNGTFANSTATADSVVLYNSAANWTVGTVISASFIASAEL